MHCRPHYLLGTSTLRIEFDPFGKSTGVEKFYYFNARKTDDLRWVFFFLKADLFLEIELLSFTVVFCVVKDSVVLVPLFIGACTGIRDQGSACAQLPESH